MLQGPDMVVELYPVAGRSTRGLLRIWYIGNFRGSVNDIQEKEWRKQPGTFVWTSLAMSAQVYLQYAPDSPVDGRNGESIHNKCKRSEVPCTKAELEAVELNGEGTSLPLQEGPGGTGSGGKWE